MPLLVFSLDPVVLRPGCNAADFDPPRLHGFGNLPDQFDPQQAVVEGTSDALWVVDRTDDDRWVISMANSRTERMLGVIAADIVGRELGDILPAAAAELLRARLAQEATA